MSVQLQPEAAHQNSLYSRSPDLSGFPEGQAKRSVNTLLGAGVHLREYNIAK